MKSSDHLDEPHSAAAGWVVVHCFCGQTARVHKDRFPGELTTDTGFRSVSNVRDGLYFQYLCPACFDRVQPALATLIEVFGDDARYIHYSTLLSRHMPRSGSTLKDP